MKIKRTMLLASMALAAIAFLVPATASASGTWTDDHKKLGPEDATLDLTGNLGFEIPGVLTFKCDVHVEATLTETHDGKIVKTGKGHVNKIEITTDKCVGTGALATCTLKGHQVKGLPWELTATKTDIDIKTEAKIDYQFEKCAIGEITTAVPTTTLTPDDATTFSHFVISGNAAGGGKATGTLQLPAGQAKKYGVHEPGGEE